VVRKIACDEGDEANVDGRTVQPPAHGQPAGRLVAQSAWFDYDVTNASFQQPVELLLEALVRVFRVVYLSHYL
jgi:hypothetical protein